MIYINRIKKIYNILTQYSANTVAQTELEEGEENPPRAPIKPMDREMEVPDTFGLI